MLLDLEEARQEILCRHTIRRRQAGQLKSSTGAHPVSSQSRDNGWVIQTYPKEFYRQCSKKRCPFSMSSHRSVAEAYHCRVHAIACAVLDCQWMLEMVEAYATLIGYVRGVDCDCKAMCLRALRQQWSRCSLLSANRVRLGTICDGSKPESKRLFVDSTKGHKCDFRTMTSIFES